MISSRKVNGKNRFQYAVYERGGLTDEQILKRYTWAGDGCSKHPSCLTCPFDINKCPVIQSKERKGGARERLKKRNKEIMEYIKTHTKKETCTKFSIGIHGLNAVIRRLK